MEKLILMVKGYISCFGWMISAIFQWILEECPDLKFWKGHKNFDDHIWYAERVNGRIAMLVLTVLSLYELTTHSSIRDLLNDIKLHTVLFGH